MMENRWMAWGIDLEDSMEDWRTLETEGEIKDDGSGRLSPL